MKLCHIKGSGISETQCTAAHKGDDKMTANRTRHPMSDTWYIYI